jgi:hypothetical protein
MRRTEAIYIKMGERGRGRDERDEGKKERWRFLIYLLCLVTS